MKKWEILKETDVSPSDWFPVVQHQAKLPNGKIIDDYFISPMGNVVMILAITSKNEIVFVKQYKHAAGKILLELPAGFQQKGKTLKESALSELEEEIGIKTNKNNLIFLGKVTNNPTKIKQTTYFYLAKNLRFNSKTNFDTTEEIEIVKISPRKILGMIKNGKIWVADSIACVTKAFLKYPDIFK